jgi:hypothetical protein
MSSYCRGWCIASTPGNLESELGFPAAHPLYAGAPMGFGKTTSGLWAAQGASLTLYRTGLKRAGGNSSASFVTKSGDSRGGGRPSKTLLNFLPSNCRQVCRYYGCS